MYFYNIIIYRTHIHVYVHIYIYIYIYILYYVDTIERISYYVVAQRIYNTPIGSISLLTYICKPRVI
jgi:hypothetical protein